MPLTPSRPLTSADTPKAALGPTGSATADSPPGTLNTTSALASGLEDVAASTQADGLEGAGNEAAESTDGVCAPQGSSAHQAPSPRWRAGLPAVAGVAALAVAVQAVLWRKFQLPLWYDELWRPHFAAEPVATFWSELGVANSPSAFGSLALVRLCGEMFGWHAWSLRLPSAVPFIALAVGTWLLARRLTGRWAALGATVTVTVAGTMVDLASQIKPYTLDAACALAVVGLWMNPRPSTGTGTGRVILRRCCAGVLAVFSLPALFLIVPLAVQETVRPLWSRRGQPWSGGSARTALRAAVRAAAIAAPAVLIAGVHALVFVAHQSGQRASTFWDDHFLADRGPLDAARLLVGQLAATAAGAPPGIDRYDPNLVHPLTDDVDVLVAVLGCAVAITFVTGVITLARRADGRVLLVAIGGAELLMAAASALRYWPFGAVRPNTFLVPLLTIVSAVGAATLARTVANLRPAARAGHPASGRGPAGWTRALAAAGTLVLLAVAVVPVAAATSLRPLWDDRGTRRPIDLMVDVTVTARRLSQPGDLVLVGGRLARAGWLYGMEFSEDPAVAATTPTDPATATDPPAPTDPPTATGSAGSTGPGRADSPRPGPVGTRVPASATVFLTAVDDGGVGRALARRTPGQGGRVLLFVLAYDRGGTERALAEARQQGWCPSWAHDFELTGTLRVLTRCER